MSGDLAPDADAAITFLELLHPGGPWVLTAITPDGPTTTETFTRADTVAKWVERQNVDRNIYVMAAEAAGTLRKKASKDDVAQTSSLWSDLDGVSDLSRLNGHAPPPTITVESGGGLNLYWALSEPIRDREEIEARNRWLAQQLGGDHCWNADRILRLPGTINWPNRKKRSNGRVPVLARCAEHRPDRVYGSHDFGRIDGDQAKDGKHTSDLGDDTPLLTLDDLPAEIRGKLSALARRLIQEGPMQGEYDDDRSRAVFAVTAALIRAGASDDQIAGILLNPELPIHAHIADQKGHGPRAYVARQIERAREWVKKGHEAEDGGASEAGDGGTPEAEPLDFLGAPELVGWPELTAECVPAALFRYAQGEAKRLNVDPCPLAALALAACCASISDEFRFKPKAYDHWTQQARLWVCVIKDVGGRGTDMIKSAIGPVKKRDLKLFREWQLKHAAWKARQAQKTKKGKDKGDGNLAGLTEGDDDPEPKSHRLLSNDATPEKVADMLKDGGDFAKLTLEYDELVSFFGMFGRYSKSGATARADMLKAYDGGPHMIDRVIRGTIHVANWSVNILGNIQPRRLRGLAKDLIDDGLEQRFLNIHAKPPTPGLDDDQPTSPDLRENYFKLHEALAQLRPVTGILPGGNTGSMPCFTDKGGHEVRRRFKLLIDRLLSDQSLPTIIRETAPKWSGLLIRISLAFHLIEIATQRLGGAAITDPEVALVPSSTMNMAATFLRKIALPNLFRLGFETMAEEGEPTSHARWIAGHILAHGLARITGYEVGRAYRPLRGKGKEITEAMEVLVHGGWATRVGARRDAVRWEIDPRVHTVFAAAAAKEKARRAAAVELVRTKVSDL